MRGWERERRRASVVVVRSHLNLPTLSWSHWAAQCAHKLPWNYVVRVRLWQFRPSDRLATDMSRFNSPMKPNWILNEKPTNVLAIVIAVIVVIVSVVVVVVLLLRLLWLRFCCHSDSGVSAHTHTHTTHWVSWNFIWFYIISFAMQRFPRPHTNTLQLALIAVQQQQQQLLDLKTQTLNNMSLFALHLFPLIISLCTAVHFNLWFIT